MNATLRAITGDHELHRRASIAGCSLIAKRGEGHASGATLARRFFERRFCQLGER